MYNILQRSTAKGRLLAEQVRRSIPMDRPVVSQRMLQFRSVNNSFEPICPHITKDDCAKTRRHADPSHADGPPSICDRIHFRPLLRPHTDPSLGHCSYLNTCYSEPTYAQSPSIPPLPSHRQIGYGMQGAGTVSLPSGLGAGGRGKEKAPCRYLHFEVDWDVTDGGGQPEYRQDLRKKPYKLGIGLGPAGRETQVVSALADGVRRHQS